MSIYIKKSGQKQKISIPASDIQIFDVGGRFENSNLEDVLKTVDGIAEANTLQIESLKSDLKSLIEKLKSSGITNL